MTRSAAAPSPICRSINTADIERLNATFRARLAVLVRKSRCLARQAALCNPAVEQPPKFLTRRVVRRRRPDRFASREPDNESQQQEQQRKRETKA